MTESWEPIPFNKPCMVGKELEYIADAVHSGHLSGDGPYTLRCAHFLEQRFGVPKVLMTPSCTAALEMAAMLCDLQPGDEVIMPSYTFVSTANAVVRLGAKPVFVDIRPDTLNIDETKIEDAITSRTRAILPVHYAGVGCEMERIMDIARGYKLWVIEDAAQGVNAFYQNRALGAIGHLGCYSFHETKNLHCGEGGALCINDPALIERAEIIRDKGTNRKQFFRGLVDKYTWVDVGSSYVPSEVCGAFLWAQLEALEEITERRRQVYETYRQELTPLAVEGQLSLPVIPEDCVSNSHLFYLLLNQEQMRNELLEHLQSLKMHAVFHYIPLHNSPGGIRFSSSGPLPVTEELSSRLLRLPLYMTLSPAEQLRIVAEIRSFFAGSSSRDRLAARSRLST